MNENGRVNILNSNNNTVLELNNPARNAEISYQVSSNNIAFSDITILGNENSFVPQSSGVEQSISYYFRLAEGLELTTYNPLLLFASIADKISVIKDTSGNTITPEFGFNNVGDFNSLGRTGNPNEISKMTTFLASNQVSSYITGECITIDGGLI